MKYFYLPRPPLPRRGGLLYFSAALLKYKGGKPMKAYRPGIAGGLKGAAPLPSEGVAP